MNTTQWLFIAFVLITSGGVVAVTAKCVGTRAALIVALGLAAWFAYVAALSYFGVLRRSEGRPPGAFFILAPVLGGLITAALLSVTKTGTRLVMTVPLALAIGGQVFRLGVELFIHKMWAEGLVPRMLTFNGANVDIYVALTAPVIAVLALNRRWGPVVAWTWNVAGLLALANVVVRAILSTPGPLDVLHTEPPNAMFVTFPFMFIPAFFVPLAVTLHLIAIRITWVSTGHAGRQTLTAGDAA